MPLLTLLNLVDEFNIHDFTITITYKTEKTVKYSSKVRKLKSQILDIIYDNNLNPERIKVLYFDWTDHAKFSKIQCVEV